MKVLANCMEVGKVLANWRCSEGVSKLEVGKVLANWRCSEGVSKLEVGKVLANWRWGRCGTKLANTRWLARTWLYPISPIIIICGSKEIFCRFIPASFSN